MIATECKTGKLRQVHEAISPAAQAALGEKGEVSDLPAEASCKPPRPGYIGASGRRVMREKSAGL